jgi:tripartite-type tricarboxylate transporter receptor subunit TctC
MLAPAGVPDFVVKRIHAGIVEVLKEPSVAKSIVSAGADPQGGTPEEMAGYLKSEIAKWTKVIKEANLVVK